MNSAILASQANGSGLATAVKGATVGAGKSVTPKASWKGRKVVVTSPEGVEYSFTWQHDHKPTASDLEWAKSEGIRMHSEGGQSLSGAKGGESGGGTFYGSEPTGSVTRKSPPMRRSEIRPLNEGETPISLDELDTREIANTPTKDLVSEVLAGPKGRNVSTEKRYRAVIDELQNRATTAGVNIGGMMGPGGKFIGGHGAGMVAGGALQGADLGMTVNKVSAGGTPDIRDNINLITTTPQFNAAAGIAIGAAAKGGANLAKAAAKKAIPTIAEDAIGAGARAMGPESVPAGARFDIPNRPLPPKANVQDPLADIRKQIQDIITQSRNATPEQRAMQNATFNLEEAKRIEDLKQQGGFYQQKPVVTGQGDNLEGVLQQSIDNATPAQPTTWYRGESGRGGDLFYSASKDVAGDYGPVSTMDPSQMPKNPLVVGSKHDLIDAIGYKHGDPLAEDINIPNGEKFDTLARAHAERLGHDGIIYRDGSFGEPELHSFSKPEPPISEPTPAAIAPDASTAQSSVSPGSGAGAPSAGGQIASPGSDLPIGLANSQDYGYHTAITVPDANLDIIRQWAEFKNQFSQEQKEWLNTQLPDNPTDIQLRNFMERMGGGEIVSPSTLLSKTQESYLWKQVGEDPRLQQYGWDGQKVFDDLRGKLNDSHPPVPKRFFTDEALAQAQRDLREGGAGAGLGDLGKKYKALLTIGGYHLESGIRDFGAWSARVLQDVGEWAKPYLERAWKEAHETLGETAPPTAGTKSVDDIPKGYGGGDVADRSLFDPPTTPKAQPPKKGKGPFGKSLDALDMIGSTMREGVATGDVSFPGVQGFSAIFTDSNAWVSGLRKSFRSYGTAGYADTLAKMKADPDFNLIKATGVDLPGFTGESEELFQNSLLQKVPGVGKGVKAAARSYDGGATTQRFYMVKARLELAKALNGGKELSKAELKIIGDGVNTMTGRASSSLGLKVRGADFGRGIFAPSYWVSQFEAGLQKPLMQAIDHGRNTGEWATTKLHARKAARLYGGAMAVLATAKVALENSGWEVEVNPMNANSVMWGKAYKVVDGEVVSVDLLPSQISTATRFFAQFTFGRKGVDGKTDTSLYGRMSAWQSLLEGKMSPMLKMILNISDSARNNNDKARRLAEGVAAGNDKGEDANGRKVDMTTGYPFGKDSDPRKLEGLKNIGLSSLPISSQQAKEVYESKALTLEEKLLLLPLMVISRGPNVYQMSETGKKAYEKRDFPPKKSSSHSTSRPTSDSSHRTSRPIGR